MKVTAPFIILPFLFYSTAQAFQSITFSSLSSIGPVNKSFYGRSTVTKKKNLRHAADQQAFRVKKNIHKNSSNDHRIAVGTQLNNSLLESLEAVGSPLASLSVLAGVVLVHEMGHFLAASYFKVKIQEFSVGFGPKLLSFKNENDIDFSLRALPLGGYVSFPENYNRTLAYEMEMERFKLRKELGLERKTVLGSLFDKIFNEEVMSEEKAPLVVEVKEETKKPWFVFSFKPKKEKEIPPKIDPNKPISIDYYDDPDLLQNRPWYQRAVVLVGGVVFNILLAFTLYFGSATVGPGIPNPQFDTGALVTTLSRSDAPAKGYLEAGDVIVGINGHMLDKSSASSARTSMSTISEIIQEIRNTPSGDTVELSVIKKSSMKGDPVAVSVKPQRNNGNNGPQTLGVMLAPNYVKTELIKTSNVAQAATVASSQVYDITSETAGGFLNLIKSLLRGDSTASANMSGPIGVIKTGSDVVSQKDVFAIVAFAATISINLAVVNSFPFPALDGGQLLFVFVEVLRGGKRLDQRVEEEINAIFLLGLLFISLSSSFGDVTSLVMSSR